MQSVKEVIKFTVSHPVEMFLFRWNWKAALLSGLMRAPIYLFTHLKHGWRAAFGSALLEFIFRLIISGASGSLVQAFHKARPIWLSTLCIMLFLPGFSHLIEFGIHTLNGDANTGKAISISIALSVVSALFSLFAMRRGALLVKDERQESLWKDIKKFPLIIAEFIFYPAILIWRKTAKNAEILSLSQSPDTAE